MRTPIRLAAIVALLLTLVPPITASAGVPIDPNLGDTVLGTTGGVRYASDPAAYDAVSSFAEVEVGCGGPRWHLIGGGSAAGGADPLKWDAASRPYDYDDPDTLGDDGWLAQGFGPSGSEVTGYSICVRDGDLSYPIKTIADSPTGSRTGSVSCGGARWQVTNGSAFIATTGSWVQSTFPKDGRDADTVPGDGWKGTVYDALGGSGSFGMYAVCAAGVDLSYVRGTPATLVAGSGAITRKVACRASDHVVGGGARWSGPADKARLASSFPYDGPDGDDVPDDGWQTRAYGISGADKTVTPFAICLG